MKAGVHSAILNLVDPATAGIAYRVLNTVVAAEQMTVLNNFATSYVGQVDRADSARLFLNVPAGAGALKVEMKVMSGSVRATLYQPAGLPVGRTGYCSAGAACEGGAGTISRTVSLPAAGVWEVALEGSARSAASPAGYTLRGSLLGVSMAPAAWVVDPAPVGTGVSQAVTFTNRFAAFTGGATGTDLGSAFTARPTIAQGAQQTFTVDVPALSTLLTAKVGNPSDTRAQLALSVLDPAGRQVNVPLRNPAAGIYTVVVNAVSVPSGSTQFDYEDYFDNAAFGRVSISDAPAPHPFQGVWTGIASVTPMAAPAAGRYLRGHLQVMSGGVVVSSAAVELRNVQ
jgi:hypothetical protein